MKCADGDMFVSVLLQQLLELPLQTECTKEEATAAIQILLGDSCHLDFEKAKLFLPDNLVLQSACHRAAIEVDELGDLVQERHDLN
jgi:hypothetical protein